MLSQVSDILESVHKIQVSSQRQHFFQAMSPFSRFNWKHSMLSSKNYSNKITPGSLPYSSTDTSRTLLPPIRNFLRIQKVKRKSAKDLQFQNTKVVFFAHSLSKNVFSFSDCLKQSKSHITRLKEIGVKWNEDRFLWLGGILKLSNGKNDHI
jgi:hypothetical protein